MTLHSRIYSSTILLFFFCVIAYGQKDETIAGKKYLTVFQIDSICNFIDNNTNLAEGIIEGEFYDQKGGWETYDLKSKKGDTLFRIRHNSSTGLYHKTTFYYFNREVIKSIVTIEDWNPGSTMKSVYSATYYFQNNISINVLNEDPKYSTASDVLKQGQNYQDDFYRNR